MKIYEDERLKEMLINILNKILIFDPPNTFSSSDNMDIIDAIKKKISKYLYYICEDYDVRFLDAHIDHDNDTLSAIDYAIKCDDTMLIIMVDFANHTYLEISEVDEAYYYSEKEKKKIIKELFSRE